MTLYYAYLQTTFFRGLWFPRQYVLKYWTDSDTLNLQFDPAFVVCHTWLWKKLCQFNVGDHWFLMHEDNVSERDIRIRMLTNNTKAISLSELKASVEHELFLVDKVLQPNLDMDCLNAMLGSHALFKPISGHPFSKLLLTWIQQSSFRYHFLMPVREKDFALLNVFSMVCHPNDLVLFLEACENKYCSLFQTPKTL